MALKKCKDCGHEISKSAKVCQNCGKKQGTSIFIKLIGILFIICGLSAIFSVNTDNTKDTQNTSAYATIEKFEEIDNGMTYEEVVKIMGFEGTLSAESSAMGSSYKIYYWYAKNGISNVTVSFFNGEVTGKSQIGL